MFLNGFLVENYAVTAEGITQLVEFLECINKALHSTLVLHKPGTEEHACNPNT